MKHGAKMMGLVVAALLLAPIPGHARNNNQNRNRSRTTKGAPAKGPSDKTFSQTLQSRLSSMGTPDSQDASLKAEAERKVQRVQKSNSSQKTDAYFLSRLQTQLNANPELLEKPDAEGRTLLHQAAFAGYPECVQYLLKRGANRDARDPGGATAADLARRSGFTGIADTIEQFGR